MHVIFYFIELYYIFFEDYNIMIFQYKKLPAEIIKYVIIWCIVVGLIVIIPYNKLGIKDSFILAIILTLTIAIIENISAIIINDTKEPFDAVSNEQTTAVSNKTTANTTAEQKTDVVVNTEQKTEQTSEPDTKVVEKTIEVVENKPIETKITRESLYKEQPNEESKEAIGSRSEDDLITSDIPYTDYHHIPIGDTYKPSDFEYGYSFLPPEKWYPTPPFPPVCVSEKRCPINPTFTTGTPVDVKEWHSASKIMPPAGINTKYIKEKLNAGR